MTISNEKVLENAKDTLITADRKHRGYILSIVNETILDRTYATKFLVDDIYFNSLAQYILYRRCKLLNLSSELIADVAQHYKAPFPITVETDEIPWEVQFFDNNFDIISEARRNTGLIWKEQCVFVATEAILELAKQSSTFRVALLETHNNVIVEMSKSLLWGIDAQSSLLSDIAHPELWGGENCYGQALMTAREILKAEAKFSIKRLMLSRKGV